MECRTKNTIGIEEDQEIPIVILVTATKKVGLCSTALLYGRTVLAPRAERPKPFLKQHGEANGRV